ncbi:class I SAM-dependent methyltransferase [Halioxenophilus aromaticivorans]|uniref:Methyltransferase domain-containing protein n=1 Tax=Halioxenophilus aromaticivorans TaxID=1306992 RepID=A0AAV3TWT2_9ALTE
MSEIKKVHGIYVLKKNSPTLANLRQALPEPSIHGYKVWSSSFLIMDYLKYEPFDIGSSVLDIGCGWGMLGIYCAKSFKAKVTGVDADEWVFPYLRVHAAMNDVKVKTHTSLYQDIPANMLTKHDVMLGGDICFWDELVEPLYDLVSRAVKKKVGYIIIADPGRSPFMKLAKKCKKDFGGELIPWQITKPRADSGYLLVIRTK